MLTVTTLTFLLAALAVGPALAQEYPPFPGPDDEEGTLLSDTVVVPGQAIIIQSGGWLPGSNVDIFLFSDPVLLATVNAGANGRIRAEVTIPPGVEPGAHTLRTRGLDSDGNPREDVVPVTVAQAADGDTADGDTAATPPAPPLDPSLAATGANLTNGVALMALLVLAGTGILLVQRRRRGRTETLSTDA